MIESSCSLAVWQSDIFKELFSSSDDESELLEESLDETDFFFFFLSFFEAFETLLALLTLLTLELVSLSSSENPGFFLKAV